MIPRLRRDAQIAAGRLIVIFAFLAGFSTPPASADQITGSVFNRSRSQPAAGDEVTAVQLDSTTQEVASTKTDARGRFTLHVRHASKTYLVRASHQGVSYELQASAGAMVPIEVFDAVPEVRGITGSIEILRAGTKGDFLHVSDMLEVVNESTPPLTLAGRRTLDVYLPANAEIDSVLAAGPEKPAAMIPAALVTGQPGHYTVSFPLRPGATRFAFNYDLPYDGRAVFHTRHAYPLQQFAVMIPPTMEFASRSPEFQILEAGDSHYQVRAANRVKVGEGPEFAILGNGDLPLHRGSAKSQVQSDSLGIPRPIQAPGRTAWPRPASIGLEPIRSPSQSLVLEILSAILLVTCIRLVWRVRKARNFPAAQRVAPGVAPGKHPQLS